MAERLTKEQEEAIRERAAQASDGPWAWESTGDDGSWRLGVVDPPQTCQIIEQYDEETCTFAPLPDVVEFIAESGHSATLADADFIAHARDDVPTLLDEIAALRAELLSEKQRSGEYMARCSRAYNTLVKANDLVTVDDLRMLANIGLAIVNGVKP